MKRRLGAMIRVGQSFILLMAVVLVSATLSWGQGVDAREQDAVQKLLAFRNQLQLIDERFRDHINVPLVDQRSEEHTSELQSHSDLVCRLLLEKKKKTTTDISD